MTLSCPVLQEAVSFRWPSWWVPRSTWPGWLNHTSWGCPWAAPQAPAADREGMEIRIRSAQPSPAYAHPYAHHLIMGLGCLALVLQRREDQRGKGSAWPGLTAGK